MAEASPDIMNDLEYATNEEHGNDDSYDPDTCRICRGEGGVDEPLFYPCKCSGSIKFVHQECLMEWLSHSQKKYCELCKTPFRFTKLYSPQMPQKLPTSVFARHMVINLVRNITTWLRFCLVVAVWLGLLPFVIRQFWRFIFWFSDGGWPPSLSPSASATTNATTAQALEIARELQLATLAGNGTSPVTPLYASQTTAASIGGAMDKLLSFLLPFAQSLNINNSDPLTAGFAKSLYYGFGLQSMGAQDGSMNNTSMPQLFKNLSHSTERSTTLLSEVSIFNNLTRSRTINSIVISIVEGYVITFLIVVSFILVFLIREWVVQQQPGINMGAGFNAEFAGAEGRRNREGRNVVNPNVPNIDAAAGVPNDDEQGAIAPRDIARPRRRIRDEGDVEREHRPGRTRGHAADQQDDLLTDNGAQLDAGPGESSSHNRPVMPGRDALDTAAEFQRRLDEEPKMTREFLNIWQRAEGNATEVLRIIEEENLSVEMAYWVSAMKILQVPTGAGVLRLRPSLPSSRDEVDDNHVFASKPKDTAVQSTRLGFADSEEGRSSSDSWVDIFEPGSTTHVETPASMSTEDSASNMSLDKGKGKSAEAQTEPTMDSGTEALPVVNMQSKDASKNSTDVEYLPSAQEHTSELIHKENLYPSGSWSFANLSPMRGQSDQDQDLMPGMQTSHTPSAVREDPRKANSTDFPESSSPRTTDQAWKDIQALRVQHAVIRGREARQAHIDKDVMNPPNLDITSSKPQDNVNQDYKSVKVLGKTATGHSMGKIDSEDHSAISEAGQEENLDIRYEQDGTETTTEQNSQADVAQPGAVEQGQELPELRMPAPAAPQPGEAQGFIGQIADWLWARPDNEWQFEGDDADDEQIVQNIAAEAPFVPRQDIPNGAAVVDQEVGIQNQDREVVEAALAAGLDPNDPEGIDDAEDFDGIMELVGMRGPLSGLLQNALFSAFLLALAVAIGIWIPYNIGRVTLLLTANPGPAFKLPLRLGFGVAAFLQDVGLAFVGFMAYCTMYTVYLPLKLSFYLTGISNNVLGQQLANLGGSALRIAYVAFDHGMNGTINGLINIADSDLLTFSAASHESLLTLKMGIAAIFAHFGAAIRYVCAAEPQINIANVWIVVSEIIGHCWRAVLSVPSFVMDPDSWVISLEVAKRASPLDPALSIWGSWDRFWATLTGYSTLTFLGALYISKGSPFSNSQVGRDWEAAVIDLLNQAGGVMKVILIISIEMLVFPLYCGLLLDAALLPLFEDATILSRVLFTLRSPVTSIFVHWFVGTCYMFHFALFVSMCRKIMRKGVLYFIRDPDDPTFHPVRDVLERNVGTQLRKILFSALVYGALVVVCLGGVVWGLSFAFKGVLPIHWSSNEPVLEFPVDLLFYNFLMPLAVRFFKPSDGLHMMYSWWFRRCARMLRLTWFMFDERKLDEEGHYVLQTWGDVICYAVGKLPDPEVESSTSGAILFVHDGKYVRTPASDQVRIPKETNVFLEVTEANERADGMEDRPDGLHGKDSASFKQVYIPPYFRFRLFLFILTIWLFAAVTGVGVTVIPLVFGRQVFARLVPSHVRKNDVYAFSIGIYILGTALYAILHAKQFFRFLRMTITTNTSTRRHLVHQAAKIANRVGGTAWTYAAFIFVLPTLSAFLVEFYVLIPVHTYFAPGEPHVVHFVQSWTLGLLYVKLSTRMILWCENSRPAEALRAITRDGYLNPDARLATRSFILPATVVLGTLLTIPWTMASLACNTFFKNASEREIMLIYRYAYPMMFSAVIVGLACLACVGMIRHWKQKIKDEVYLIGERLHNFGDNRKPGVSVNLPHARVDA